MSDNELSHDGSDAAKGDKAKKRKRSRSPSPDRKMKNQKKGKDDKKGFTPAGKGRKMGPFLGPFEYWNTVLQ